MTYEEFNAFCAGLKGSAYIRQWGGAHVWKVGGKVFAIGGWEERQPAFTFKTTLIGFEMLRGRPGLRPAPYFASRGMLWIQHFASPGLSDEDLAEHVSGSYALVLRGLSRRKRVDSGL